MAILHFSLSDRRFIELLWAHAGEGLLGNGHNFQVYKCIREFLDFSYNEDLLPTLQGIC